MEFVTKCYFFLFKISADIPNRNINQTFINDVHMYVRRHCSMLVTCIDLYGSQLWSYGAGYPETFYVGAEK